MPDSGGALLPGAETLHVLPWYVAGPLIGLFVPALLLVGNRMFGVSGNLRHLCAATVPTRAEFFRYDWRGVGGWNLAFVTGVLLGGVIVGALTSPTAQVALSPAALQTLTELGIRDATGLVPHEVFSWQMLTTVRGALLLLGGGFLIGFGTAYAGGCTSGHAITGLADFQLPSLVAVIGFFAGGLVSSWVLLPLLLTGGAA